MTQATDRESIPEPQNPLGIDGIEFIEFATSRPQALGGVLETFGFRPIARHRSREVELYRQGTMNIVVNAQPADVPRTVMPSRWAITSPRYTRRFVSGAPPSVAPSIWNPSMRIPCMLMPCMLMPCMLMPCMLMPGCSAVEVSTASHAQNDMPSAATV